MERKPRFVELFTSVISGRRLEEVALIILHIHTRFDPCSVCAEMLSNLSQTLNYLPRKLLLGEEEQTKRLCKQLESHSCQFLIEVSSDRPYWNSREAGFDELYAMQLADITGLGAHPIEILSTDKFPVPTKKPFSHTNIISNVTDNILPFYYFPPFVIFKRMDHFSVLRCLKKVGDPPAYEESNMPYLGEFVGE